MSSSHFCRTSLQRHQLCFSPQRNLLTAGSSSRSCSCSSPTGQWGQQLHGRLLGGSGGCSPGGHVKPAAGRCAGRPQHGCGHHRNSDGSSELNLEEGPPQQGQVAGRPHAVVCVRRPNVIHALLCPSGESPGLCWLCSAWLRYHTCMPVVKACCAVLLEQSYCPACFVSWCKTPSLKHSTDCRAVHQSLAQASPCMNTSLALPCRGLRRWTTGG